MISPTVDLLFIGNLPWLLAFLPLLVNVDSLPRIEFWQIYFLTTPHRWLTLGLVATDPDRRGDQTKMIVWIGVALLALVVIMRSMTGAFACLAVLDYVWNAWHFGSQHAGILRIYSRRGGGSQIGLERWAFRVIVPYTALRLAAWITGWIETDSDFNAAMHFADHFVLLLAACLVLLEVINFRSARTAALCYTLSVCALYSSLLWAVSYGNAKLVLSLTVAASAFHAVEYLAFVSFYARRRRTMGSTCAFRIIANQWGLFLASYMAVLSLGGYAFSQRWVDLWLGANLWVALMHYAYDGMIWKLRKPATAAALDAA